MATAQHAEQCKWHKPCVGGRDGNTLLPPLAGPGAEAELTLEPGALAGEITEVRPFNPFGPGAPEAPIGGGARPILMDGMAGVMTFGFPVLGRGPRLIFGVFVLGNVVLG